MTSPPVAGGAPGVRGRPAHTTIRPSLTSPTHTAGPVSAGIRAHRRPQRGPAAGLARVLLTVASVSRHLGSPVPALFCPRHARPPMLPRDENQEVGATRKGGRGRLGWRVRVEAGVRQRRQGRTGNYRVGEEGRHPLQPPPTLSRDASPPVFGRAPSRAQTTATHHRAQGHGHPREMFGQGATSAVDPVMPARHPPRPSRARRRPARSVLWV